MAQLRNRSIFVVGDHLQIDGHTSRSVGFIGDLFKDHPEEIVIAERTGLEARFSRLSDRADLNEILGEAHLGDVWYSGVLGGVPVGT